MCEYRTYKVYPVGSDEEKALAREYELNNEGSYVLQTAYPVPGMGHHLCFDTTRRFKDIGRLINHSATEYNLKPGRPTYQWRVGMIAVRDIQVDQELTYDYGVRTEGWMRARGDSAVAEEKEDDVQVVAEDEEDAVQVVAEDEEDAVQVVAEDGKDDVQLVSKPSPLPSFKRNYF